MSAMPASSMINKVDGPTAAAQSGSSPWSSDQVSLARVSVRMPVCSARTAAAAADGARPTTWPPSWVQARVRARIAVVFPAPAGAIASCTRAQEAHICRTSEACPASSAVPLAAISSRARSTAAARPTTAATSRRSDETGLGVEDPLRGVEVGPGDGVDRRPVEPPQHLRLLDAVNRYGQGNRPAIEHLIDQQVHQGTRRPVVKSMVRTCRCASARTCHICQFERLCSIAAKTRPAVCATQRASTILVASAGGQRRVHHRRDSIRSTQHR